MEIAVGTTDVAGLELAMALPARLTGRFIFNGAEEPDPARTQFAPVPDGSHAAQTNRPPQAIARSASKPST